jgi:hypothetical protein
VGPPLWGISGSILLAHGLTWLRLTESRRLLLLGALMAAGSAAAILQVLTTATVGFGDLRWIPLLIAIGVLPVRLLDGFWSRLAGRPPWLEALRRGSSAGSSNDP